MKTTILKISFIFLLFTLIGTGCKKEEEYEDISLVSLKCPCEHDVAFIKKTTVENILLFDAEKTSWDVMKTQTFDGEKSEFVYYSVESKSSVFYSIRNSMTGISYVCNVPEKINDWTIPSTGVVISFNADAFEACTSPPSFNSFYSTSVLTTLKRRIK